MAQLKTLSLRCTDGQTEAWPEMDTAEIARLVQTSFNWGASDLDSEPGPSTCCFSTEKHGLETLVSDSAF